MFLDQKLRNIQKRKNNLMVCCDLRRRLVHIELEGFFLGLRSTLSNLTMGVVMVKEVFRYWHQYKNRG